MTILAWRSQIVTAYQEEEERKDLVVFLETVIVGILKVLKRKYLNKGFV